MKRRIRLTESDLHNLIKESVKKVLREDLEYHWGENGPGYYNLWPTYKERIQDAALSIRDGDEDDMIWDEDWYHDMIPYKKDKNYENFEKHYRNFEKGIDYLENIYGSFDKIPDDEYSKMSRKHLVVNRKFNGRDPDKEKLHTKNSLNRELKKRDNNNK